MVPVSPFMLFDYYLMHTVSKEIVREAMNNLLARCDEVWIFGHMSLGVKVDVYKRQLRRGEVVPCARRQSVGESQVVTTFKRVSLAGSEELFRPTRPQVVSDTDDVIREAVDRPAKVKEVVYRTLQFTEEEIALLVEAIQTAKYPDRARAKPALDKFDYLDALRIKVQGESGAQ